MMRELRRMFSVSVASAAFVNSFIVAKDVSVARELLSSYVASESPLTEKLVTLSYCMARCADAGIAWFLYLEIGSQLEQGDKRAACRKIVFSQIHIIKKIRIACRIEQSRLWLQVIMVKLGERRAVKSAPSIIDRADDLQKKAILVGLNKLRTRRANGALDRIARSGSAKWIRVVAGLFLVFKRRKSGIVVLSKEAEQPDDDDVSQCEAYFGLAWAGDRQGVEGIKRIVASQPTKTVLVQLCRNIDAYGNESPYNSDLFSSIRLKIEETIGRQVLLP